MSAENSFTVAVVTSYKPRVRISIQAFDLGPDGEPDAVFDDEHAPREREYPFDLNRADSAVSSRGYKRTSGWRWTGTHWGAVVQPRTGYYGSDAELAQRETRPWEQGGYEG